MKNEQSSEGMSGGAWLDPTEALLHCDPARAQGEVGSAAADLALRYGFRVGSLGLLVAPQAASELIGQLPVYPVPNTPVWFPGLVNLRGNLVPVFDLKRLLGIPEEADQAPRLLVLDKDESVVGVYADGFPKPLRLGERMARVPSLPAVLEEHVSAAHFLDDAVWLEFNHRDFFHALGQRMGTHAKTA